MNTTILKKHWALRWQRWHRNVGILASIGMVMWGLSGASHPLMTRLQPAPAQWSPPLSVVNLQHALPLPTLLQQQQIQQFQHISVVTWQGQAYYRIATSSHALPRYFAISDGQESLALDRRYAAFLASYYTGLPEANITAMRRVTQFGADYHPVNRLLPVWQVEFDTPQHLRAYVDTEQSRLATLVDDRRAWLTKVFQWGHQWSFLEAQPSLQLAVATLFLSLIVLTMLLGVVLYFRQRATAKFRLPRWGIAWWHRQASVWVALLISLLASSGLLHLWVSAAQAQRATAPHDWLADAQGMTPAQWQVVQAMTVHSLHIYGVENTHFWQVLPATMPAEALPKAQVAVLHPAAQQASHDQNHGHHHGQHPQATPPMPLWWRSLATGLQAMDAMQYAHAWAHAYLAQPQPRLLSVQWVTAFANEYGFIFKRLPVLKLTLDRADHARIYVEPATGAMAATINDADGLEGFVFAYLHKWSFQTLSKDLRDALALCAALSIALMGVLGVLLFMRRR